MVLKLRAFSVALVCVVMTLPEVSWADGANSAQPNDERIEEGDSDAQDIDDRFATEGYFGGYVAAFQQTVPGIGLTGSIYLDDGFRFGADLFTGSSKGLYGDFKSQNGSVWSAFEISNGMWFKGGLSYTRLERPTSQDPFSVLTKGIDKKLSTSEARSDALGLDFSFGQLWSRENYSISVDYVGFTLPFLRLTGAGLPLFSLNAGRVEMLYNFD